MMEYSFGTAFFFALAMFTADSGLAAPEAVDRDGVSQQGEDEDELAWRNSCAGFCSGECVHYARCKNPNLPYGLWTHDDKMAIATSGVPQVGAVAIIKTNQVWGHVAYVEAVDGANITISESNWVAGSCTQRTGTMESLNITGFFF